MKTAELIIDSAEKNVDLYYATKFLAPDPFIYFRIGEKKYLMMSDLEIDRATKTAEADKILSLSKYIKKAKAIRKEPCRLDPIIVALNENHVKNLIVPESMSFVFADYFRRRGFKIEARTNPFYPSRWQKTREELRHMMSAQKSVFSAIRLAEDMIRRSVIRKNKLYLNGKPLTSERVRAAVESFLYARGYVAMGSTIIAGGLDAIDPHLHGSGPLRPHEAIIVDVFPRSSKTLFYGDATRTFCKGAAPDGLKKLYNTVKTAQINALKKVRAGVNGRIIHQGILDLFEKEGYRTGEMDGRMQGFFHTTGHGIGLELHEDPLRIGPKDYKLKEGFVLSVEPGLYYKKIGGVRIEDLVYVTKTGCKILGSYPKRLEVL